MTPETIKLGDESGNRTVVKYTTGQGVVVYGIGVPQTWDTSLGPTWSYVIEGDRLTLVDTGCHGSIKDLEEGLEVVGYPLSAVDRIVVTHGHMDHDGNCFDVVDRSGAELWAHEVYSRLLGVNRWEKEMEWRRQLVGFPQPEDTGFVNRIEEYHQQSGRMKVSNLITDGLVDGGFTFYYTPGHSPDELCILYEGLLFSGDHILPQITPHPSVSVSYQNFQSMLPEGYQDENRCYGLRAYLTSLKRVATLGNDISVMPAHRAVHRGKFNLIGLERAGEILEHHRWRCFQLIDLIKPEPIDIAAITRKHFSNLGSDEVTFLLAYTEVMSHLELLEECGDVEMVGQERQLVRWNGTERFSAAIDGM